MGAQARFGEWQWQYLGRYSMPHNNAAAAAAACWRWPRCSSAARRSGARRRVVPRAALAPVQPVHLLCTACGLWPVTYACEGPLGYVCVLRAPGRACPLSSVSLCLCLCVHLCPVLCAGPASGPAWRLAPAAA
jgi:hypothetical protein